MRRGAFLAATAAVAVSPSLPTRVPFNGVATFVKPAEVMGGPYVLNSSFIKLVINPKLDFTVEEWMAR